MSKTNDKSAQAQKLDDINGLGELCSEQERREDNGDGPIKRHSTEQRRTLNKTHATHICSQIENPFDSITSLLAVNEIAKVELQKLDARKVVSGGTATQQ